MVFVKSDDNIYFSGLRKNIIKYDGNQFETIDLNIFPMIQEFDYCKNIHFDISSDGTFYIALTVLNDPRLGGNSTNTRFYKMRYPTYIEEIFMDSLNILKNSTMNKILTNYVHIDKFDNVYFGTHLGLIIFKKESSDIEEVNNNSEMLNDLVYVYKLYPNPIEETVQIEMLVLPKEASKLRFILYDYNGNEVVEFPNDVYVNSSDAKVVQCFDMSEIQSGAYILSIELNGKMAASEMIIVK